MLWQALDLLFGLLASLFWQEDTVDVGKHTTSSNGDSSQQLAQLLVIAYCQLNVARDNPSLLVVTSSIACQLKDLSREVLQDCCLHMTEPSSGA